MIETAHTAATGETVQRRALGTDFEWLAAPVQALHARHARVHGEITVERSPYWLVRRLADLARLPRACHRAPLTVVIAPDGRLDRWHRTINGRAMRSTQWVAGSRLTAERIGLVTGITRLTVEPSGALNSQSVGYNCYGVPLPRALLPAARATESSRDGFYHFDVRLTLPGGLFFLRYSGTLDTLGHSAEADTST